MGAGGAGGGGGSSLVPAGGSTTVTAKQCGPELQPPEDPCGLVQISYIGKEVPKPLEWHSNGALLSSAHQETTLAGSLSFENAFVGKVKCHTVGYQTLWNEAGVGLGAIESLAVMPCSAQPACSGAFVTAETPVELHERINAKSEKVYEASRGKSTLPWAGEARLEESTEKLKRFTLKNVKLTEVAPCLGAELPYEGTLEPRYTNGAKSGLKPSHVTFEGLLATKALPPENEENILHVTGEVKYVGEMVQLLTLE
jgi:hypothetical protein